MAFPVDKLDLKGELYINGSWVDASGYVYGDGANAFTINRGYSDEQKSTRASTCTFKLSNPQGLFNNRNPLSPYYGLIPRNTPFRVRVGTANSYMTGNPSAPSLSYAKTPDASAFDILGDIDVAVDIEPTSWVPGTGLSLAGKYEVIGDQRGWGFYIGPTGTLNFVWSTDGTLANRQTRTSTLTLPTTTARLAVRAFLDVNNGASGHNVQFFYSTTGILGTWIQLGTTLTTAGISSIFNSSAEQTIGGFARSGMLGVGITNFSGKIYKFLLKNSAGTVVSNVDYTTLSPGSATMSDFQGNQYSILGNIRNDAVRFAGEVSKFPYEADKTNTELYSNVTASGIIRRLTQGAVALHSPVYRKLISYKPTGYFPMESSEGVTALTNDAANGPTGTLSGSSFVSDATFPGTSGALNIDEQTAVIVGRVNPTTTTTYSSASWYSKMGAIPPSDTLLIRFFSTSGLVRRWDVVAELTTYRLDGYDITGALVATKTLAYAGVGLPNAAWTAFHLEISTSGSNMTYTLNATKVGDTASWTIGTFSLAGAAGRFTAFEIRSQTNLVDTRYAHVMMTQNKVSFVDYNYYAASYGYIGESAGSRIIRLCQEEGINLLTSGDLTDTELMGVQAADTFINLIEEVRAVDDGLLVEPQDQIGLEYFTRTALLNKATTINLNMASKHLSGTFLPIDDDLRTRNDITVSRPDGASARVEQTDGPNTVALIGRYQENLTLNSSADTRLQHLAGWRLLLGTWDESRYDQIQVQLARAPFVADPSLALAASKAGIAAVGNITGLPVYQSANDVKFLILGYEERLGQYQWDFSWNATPYGPYEPNTLIDATTVRGADATDSKLVSGVTSTATSLSVTATADPLWVTTGTPYDIRVGGEVMRVTAVSGASFPQTFTVTRSINGVVKAHSANALVRLATPFYTAL